MKNKAQIICTISLNFLSLWGNNAQAKTLTMQVYDLTFEAAEAIAILEQESAENETENVCADLDDISFPETANRQQ